MSKVASIRPTDLLSLALSFLRRSSLRSLLTMGAIAFSIAVMNYLISFGLGLENLTLGNVAKSSSLLSITVNSGSQELQPLTKKSVEKIKKIPDIQAVLPKVNIKGEVSLENQKAPATIIGVDPEYLEIGNDNELIVGSYYQKDDSQTMVVSSGFLKLFGLNAGKTPLVTFSVTLDKEHYPELPPINEVSISGVINSNNIVAYLPRQYIEGMLGDTLPNYENIKVKASSLDNLQGVSNVLIENGF